MDRTELIAEPGSLEFVIRRAFDAPRALVYRAYTDPALIRQWWGGRKFSTDIEKLDVRPGGMWRFIQHDAAGNEYAFHGVFHQVSPPERLVYTFEFEGAPGHVLLSTVDFAEQDGGTLLTDQSVFQAVPDRDAMLGSGMREDMPGVLARLDEVLAGEREKTAVGR